MALILTAICVSVTCLLIVIRIKRTTDRREMEQHSITAEALHTLLAANQEVLLFDVRQPLDLLANSEIIPGAKSELVPCISYERPGKRWAIRAMDTANQFC
jgi:hypothetical protein